MLCIGGRLAIARQWEASMFLLGTVGPRLAHWVGGLFVSAVAIGFAGSTASADLVFSEHRDRSAPDFDPIVTPSEGVVSVFDLGSGLLNYRLVGDSLGDAFGASHCVLPDLNGDGEPELAVGIPRALTVDESGMVVQHGAVRVYSGADGAPIMNLYGAPHSHFGRSVAFVGDVNGDGVGDITVGGVGYNIDGAVYGRLFIISTDDWRVTATIDGDQVNDQFGFAVLGVGDTNADGVDDFVVSAPWFRTGDPPLIRTGRLYSFHGGPGFLGGVRHFADEAVYASVTNRSPDVAYYGAGLLPGTAVGTSGETPAFVVVSTGNDPIEGTFVRYERQPVLELTSSSGILQVGPRPLGGDTDHNLQVDTDDVFVVLLDLQSDPPSIRDRAYSGDVDGDDSVGVDDLTIVVDSLGQTAPIADWLTRPEDVAELMQRVPNLYTIETAFEDAGIYEYDTYLAGDPPSPMPVAGGLSGRDCAVFVADGCALVAFLGPDLTRPYDASQSPLGRPEGGFQNGHGTGVGDTDIGGDPGGSTGVPCLAVDLRGDVNHDGVIDEQDNRAPTDDEYPGGPDDPRRDDSHYRFEDTPSDEWTPGVLVVVNDDDDNGDGVPDRLTKQPVLDDYAKAMELDNPAAFVNEYQNAFITDDDLVEIKVNVPLEWKILSGQQWRITATGSGAGTSLRVYGDRQRKTILFGVKLEDGEVLPNDGWIWADPNAGHPADEPALAIPSEVWVEAVAPSDRLGDLALRFEVRFTTPCDPDLSSPSQEPMPMDELGLTAMRVEMHDLFYWGPFMPQGVAGLLGTQGDDLNPSLSVPVLDYDFSTMSVPAGYSGLPSGVPDTRITGVVADGAALTLLRSAPLFRRPARNDEGFRVVATDEQVEWEPVVFDGLQVQLVAQNREMVEAGVIAERTRVPEAVGSIYSAQRPGYRSLNGDILQNAWWGWRQLAPSPDAQGNNQVGPNTLPDVPARLDANGAPVGYTETSIPFDHGLAYYLPPESYPHLDAADTFGHGSRGLNDQETCPIGIELTLPGADEPLGESVFKLRRAPIVYVHGIFGSAVQRNGYDASMYWSPWLHAETPMGGAPLTSPEDGMTGEYYESAFGLAVNLPGTPLPTRMYFVDYKENNIAGFDVNVPAVAEMALEVLFQYRTGSLGGHLGEHAPSVFEENAFHARVHWVNFPNGVGFRAKYGFYPPDHELIPIFPVERYAIARMDFVCHSMGGMITKMYLSALGSPTAPDRLDLFGPGGNDTYDIVSEVMPRHLTYKADPSLTAWPDLDFGKMRSSDDIRAELRHHGNFHAMHQGNWFAGPARRFVTIGTPHRGSAFIDIVAEVLAPSGASSADESVAVPAIMRDTRQFRRLLAFLRPGSSEEEIRQLARGMYRLYKDGLAPAAFIDLGTGSSTNEYLTHRSLYPSDATRREIVWHPIATTATDLGKEAVMGMLAEKASEYVDTAVQAHAIATGIAFSIAGTLGGAVVSNADGGVLDVADYAEGTLGNATSRLGLMPEDSDGVVNIYSQQDAPGASGSNVGKGSRFHNVLHNYRKGDPAFVQQTYDQRISTYAFGSGGDGIGVRGILGGFLERLNPGILGPEGQ